MAQRAQCLCITSGKCVESGSAQDLNGLCWARRHLAQVQPQQEVFGAGMRVASVAADVAAAALHRRFAAPASAGIGELAAAAFRRGGDKHFTYSSIVTAD